MYAETSIAGTLMPSLLKPNPISGLGLGPGGTAGGGAGHAARGGWGDRGVVGGVSAGGREGRPRMAVTNAVREWWSRMREWRQR